MPMDNSTARTIAAAIRVGTGPPTANRKFVTRKKFKFAGRACKHRLFLLFAEQKKPLRRVTKSVFWCLLVEGV